MSGKRLTSNSDAFRNLHTIANVDAEGRIIVKLVRSMVIQWTAHFEQYGITLRALI